MLLNYLHTTLIASYYFLVFMIPLFLGFELTMVPPQSLPSYVRYITTLVTYLYQYPVMTTPDLLGLQ